MHVPSVNHRHHLHLCANRYHVRFGTGTSPNFMDPAPNFTNILFSFAYTFTMLWLIVAVVSGTIIDNLGNLRDMRSRIADDLEQSCFICNINRSMFEETNENGFSEHVKTHHNIRDYLSFFLHLEDTDEFEYTPAEKYVADKLNSKGDPSSRWYDFFPIRQAMVLRQTARGRSAMVNVFMDVAMRMDSLEDVVTEGQRRLEDEVRRLAAAVDGSRSVVASAQ